MSSKRIYLVHHSANQSVESHLVEATSQAQAISHVVRAAMTCRVATQNDLVIYLGKGIKVERAGEVPTTNEGAADGQN